VPRALQASPFYRRWVLKLHRQTVRRRAMRLSLLFSNMVILAVILVIVLQNPHTTTAANPVTDASTVTPVTNPLDQLSSASIAETVARMDSLPETTAITNQADSQITELTTAPTDNSVITKPQVVTTALKSRADIQNYVTQSGDTLASLAAKFGVTSNSIAWSNGLSTTATLAAGTKLVIPPVNGIVYTVKTGDTPATLAVTYGASQDEIIAYNDAEINGLQPGEQVIIPNATEPAAASTLNLNSNSAWGGGTATYGDNGYDFGYCTWWVAKLRAADGDPLPTDLGNASTWAIRAAEFGLPTGDTPQVGAAVVTSTRGEGHVAYVTGVNSDGSFNISEMNVIGWDKVDTKTISGNYSFVY
jgi:surface antigen